MIGLSSNKSDIQNKQIIFDLLAQETSIYLQKLSNQKILSNHSVLVKKYTHYNHTYIICDDINVIKSNSDYEIVLDKLYLPFANNSIDKIVIFDYFKPDKISDISLYLRELWRILSSDGQLLIISLNKDCLWPIENNKFFKNSICFSCYELINLLNDNFFTTTKSSSRAFMVPQIYKLFPLASKFLDNIGSKWFIPFGGVVFVEAKKNIASTAFDEDSLSSKLKLENINA